MKKGTGEKSRFDCRQIILILYKNNDIFIKSFLDHNDCSLHAEGGVVPGAGIAIGMRAYSSAG